MERRIALVGLSGPEPHACGAGVARFPAGALFSETFDGFAMVVIGDHALAACEPVQVRVRLGRAADRTVLCVQACDGLTVLRWFEAGFVRALCLEDLHGLLRARSAVPMRSAVAADRWLPRAPARGGRAARAIDALGALEVFTVDAWAARAGCEERTLRRVLREELGLAPHDVLTRYRLFVAVLLRQDGELVDDVAIAVGYSDTPSLLRACRAQGIALPRVARRRRDPRPATRDPR